MPTLAGPERGPARVTRITCRGAAVRPMNRSVLSAEMIGICAALLLCVGQGRLGVAEELRGTIRNGQLAEGHGFGVAVEGRLDVLVSGRGGGRGGQTV